jgi:hypothetical protein
MVHSALLIVVLPNVVLLVVIQLIVLFVML